MSNIIRAGLQDFVSSLFILSQKFKIMKKRYILFLLVVVASINLKAVNYTSAQNGNWMNPFTWSPIGVPIPGDNATINHAVVMDTSLAYTLGTITVNAVGSLVQDMPVRSIWLNGPNAVFVNNGLTTIENLVLSSGSYTNSGDFNVKVIYNNINAINTGGGVINGVDSMLNDGILNNGGIINIMTFYNNSTINNNGIIQGLTTVVDSMVNAGFFNNNVGSLLKADSCTNLGLFTNDGVIEFFQFTNLWGFVNTNFMTFDDLTNFGTFTNLGILNGSNSLWNVQDFNNTVNGTITLGNSFLNADGIDFDANFNNDGSFDIGDSYYNYDTITGGPTGSITMQDTSYNDATAYMLGSFEFCDMTPPGSSPFIDFNFGVIDPTITYCQTTGIKESVVSEVSIYPNPTNGIITIEFDEEYSIEVYNVLGEKMISTKDSRIDFSAYEDGIYMLFLKDNEGEMIRHEKIIKQ
jgi:Secretion system C-terminal sorting domain